VVVRQSPGGPPLTGVQALALGYNHGCARQSDGKVRCWGDNASGQLGDGSIEFSSTPVTVRQSPGGSPLTNVVDLSLGGEHSCARLSNGEVQCWGDNAYGQLGDGTTQDRSTPVAVLQSPNESPLTGVVDLTLGVYHSCAQRSDGEVRCWGYNGEGQLGDGTTQQQLTPVAVQFRGGGGAGGTPGSCDGGDEGPYCGGRSPNGCFCDELCAQLDDCCPDKVVVCDVGGPLDERGARRRMAGTP
jgi:hypothetical protein